MIGDNIRLAVVSIRGAKVHIGISAPKEFTVDREEVHEKRNDSFSEESNLTSIPASLSDELLLNVRESSARL